MIKTGTLIFAACAMAAIGAASIAAPPAPVPAAPAGDAIKGKTVFARCGVCHSVESAGPAKMGPNLYGVVGRRAGTLPGYKYSPAMAASGLKLDEATIGRFLAGPSQVVPGTKMMIPPVANPQDRANVIAYLKSTTGGKKK